MRVRVSVMMMMVVFRLIMHRTGFMINSKKKIMLINVKEHISSLCNLVATQRQLY